MHLLKIYFSLMAVLINGMCSVVIITHSLLLWEYQMY